MRPLTLILLALACLLFAACSSGGASPNAVNSTDNGEGFTVPTPESDKGVLTATFLNKRDNAPLASQLVRLAKIYGSGTDSIYVYNESMDPGDYTNPNGFLVITGVEPGSYVFILVDPNGNYAPVSENADKLLTVDIASGQVVEMGNIYVELSPSTP